MALRPALLAAAATAALSGNAEARGWYAGLEAGANWTQDAGVRLYTTPAATPFDLTGRFDTGWTLIATVGYAMQNWRVEAELAWRSNDKDQFTALPVSTGDLDGLSAMYNMTYAFALGSGVNLSLGGGGGLAYETLDIVNVEDGDLCLAAQGIVTLDYALSPSTELTVGYRYLWVLDPDFEDNGTYYSFDDLSKHALTLGVRYTFAP